MGSILLVAGLILAVVLIAKQFLVEDTVSTPRTFPPGGFGGGGGTTGEGGSTDAALARGESGVQAMSLTYSDVSIKASPAAPAVKKRARKTAQPKTTGKRAPMKKAQPKKATKTTRKSS